VRALCERASKRARAREPKDAAHEPTDQHTGFGGYSDGGRKKGKEEGIKGEAKERE
jgi:hypothetical protein